jgi:hypothetical protein
VALARQYSQAARAAHAWEAVQAEAATTKDPASFLRATMAKIVRNGIKAGARRGEIGSSGDYPAPIVQFMDCVVSPAERRAVTRRRSAARSCRGRAISRSRKATEGEARRVLSRKRCASPAGRQAAISTAAMWALSRPRHIRPRRLPSRRRPSLISRSKAQRRRPSSSKRSRCRRPLYLLGLMTAGGTVFRHWGAEQDRYRRNLPVRPLQRRSCHRRRPHLCRSAPPLAAQHR